MMTRRLTVRIAMLLLVPMVGLALAGCPCLFNQLPTANAGADQTAATGATVTLNAAGSIDPDGGTLSYGWTQTAGTAVTLNNGTTATPSFTAGATAETLTFQVTVTDACAAIATDTVNVTVTAGNQAPVADAGPDQTVAASATVNLNGSGSSDPNGDPLTYAWTQTVGTAVVLTNADTATPSFTAGATAETLTFQLLVDDGQGATDTDTVNVTVTAAPLPDVLFIAGYGGNSVTSYQDPHTVNGNIAPDTNLQGTQTQLLQPSDIVVDTAGSLLVTNFGTNSITVYNNALSANGNFAPNRNVRGGATGLAGPVSLAVDTTNDLVFVANIAPANNILVYANASTATFNGNLAPTRTIATTTSADINNIRGINLDGSDNLYVANLSAGNILVFANASALNGDLTPTRIINSPDFAGAAIWDVYVDSGDRMYVVDQGGRILTFNNASALNGTVSANFILTVSVAGAAPTAIAVDPNGTAYIVDSANNAVYSYDNIAALNGTLAPDRTLQGANTQLNVPIRVYFLDR
ncbi:MAG TPA: PKD domain-containing protein [Phycisphaerae bacterium]|nr:PKD domain-containing protein [Phycisphaerae bacterium]